MKQHEFHSSLPPETILSRLRGKTRRWSRLDGWTSRSTWFLQERKDGVIRLILTGPARSYVFADLILTEAEGGTDITALMGAPKALYAENVAIALLLVFMAATRVFLTGSLMGVLDPLLRYGWILVVLAWTGSITRRQIPELENFIEANLLE